MDRLTDAESTGPRRLAGRPGRREVHGPAPTVTDRERATGADRATRADGRRREPPPQVSSARRADNRVLLCHDAGMDVLLGLVVGLVVGTALGVAWARSRTAVITARAQAAEEKLA